jgi:transcriptional regulator with XRE-family HTH domain
MFLQMDKEKFGLWLQKEREARGWSQSDLARSSGLHRQIINKTENGVSTPAVETYIALATALKYSPIFLLRKAGLLPDNNGNGADVKLDDWEFLLKQMTPEDEAELRQIAEMKIERRKKDQSIKTLKPKKAG